MKKNFLPIGKALQNGRIPETQTVLCLPHAQSNMVPMRTGRRLQQTVGPPQQRIVRRTVRVSFNFQVYCRSSAGFSQ